tara:strand:+ start:3265 stop:4074 length:810 start_codon:yes stop_codon:yes gene_type:complete
MKIFIATPMYGGMAKNNYTISLQNLIIRLSQAGHSVTTTTIGNESLITRARNTLAHKFVSSDFDALLFIDADHGWDAGDVLRMVESGKDFIGAIYPMKGINWDAVRNAVLVGKPNLEEYSGHFAINLLPQSDVFDANQPFRVKDIGTGMLFITRKVFEDLKPHCKTYKNNNVGNTGVGFGDEVVEYFTTFIDEDRILLSEDYAFCRMWQDIGGEVWSAPWVRITHSGDYTFSGQFAKTVELNEIINSARAAAAEKSESTEVEPEEPSEQ